MKLSITESQKFENVKPCSSLSISFDKNNLPVRLIEKIFGEFPSELYENLEKMAKENTVALDVHCYPQDYCDVTGHCYPGHVVCFDGQYPTCYGPFIGPC